MNWPPQYQIKRHRRAKSVKLRISKHHGLEITIPFKFNLKKIDSLLEEHRLWIIDKLANIKLENKDILPDEICLSFMNEVWNIRYIDCKAKLKLIANPNKEITLRGDISNIKLSKKLMIEWIK